MLVLVLEPKACYSNPVLDCTWNDGEAEIALRQLRHTLEEQRQLLIHNRQLREELGEVLRSAVSARYSTASTGLVPE